MSRPHVWEDTSPPPTHQAASQTSINASGERDFFRGAPLIRPDGKQVADIGTSEYSFGNVSEQVG